MRLCCQVHPVVFVTVDGMKYEYCVDCYKADKDWIEQNAYTGSSYCIERPIDLTA